MDGNITSEGSERSLYLTHIRYLEEKLESCQLRCDELQKQNNQLTSRHTALKKEKREEEYLKCYVNAKQMKVDHLDELEFQDQAARKQREVLKLQHRQEMQTLREEVDELNRRILEQAADLEKREQELLQVKQSLSEKESLCGRLKHKKEEHGAVIYNLEEEWRLEMIRILKQLQEMAELSVKENAQKILHEVRDHLRDWPQEMVTLQRVREDLKRDWDRLKERVAANQRKRDEIEEHLMEISGKIQHHLKVVEIMKSTYLDLEELLQLYRTPIKHLQTKWEDQSHEVPALCEQNRQKTAELDQLETGLQRERSRVRLLDGVKREASVILRHIMTLKTQRQDQEKRSEVRWKTERLLDILHSTAPEGPDSTFRPQKTSGCGKVFCPLPPLQPEGSKPENN